MLGTTKDDGHVEVLFPSVGIVVDDKDKIKKHADELKSSTDNLSSAYDNFINDKTAENLVSLINWDDVVAAKLQSLAGRTGYFNAGASAAIVYPNSTLSTAFFANSYLDMVGITDVDTNDLTTYTSNGITLHVPVDSSELNSKVISLGAFISDIGVSFAKTYSDDWGGISFGVSPKIQRLDLINYAASAYSANLNDVTKSKYRNGKTTVNLDLGVYQDFQNGFSTGFAVKNVFQHSIHSKNVDGIESTYSLNPMATVSASYRTSGWLFTSDLDLTYQKRFTDIDGTVTSIDETKDDTQFWSVGMEKEFWGWADLRIGYRYDLKGNVNHMYTAGIGISPWDVFTFELTGLYGGQNNYGGVFQTSFKF